MAFCPCYAPQTLGYAIMLTLEKRILRWKQWVNRNKQFSIEELEELENHLREEILYLTEHDQEPDQKAFDQALDILGEKGLLDEEFGKIRKSKFDKVKLWAYGQTLVILGLVVFTAIPYITPYFQKPIKTEDFTEELTGESIGRIKRWQGGYKYENLVSNNKNVYFFRNDMNNIFCYKDIASNEAFKLLDFTGTYFSINHSYRSDVNPNQLDLKRDMFDIDSNELFYFFNTDFSFDGKNYKAIPVCDIYSFSFFQDRISFPELMDPEFEVVNLKVIGKKLVVLLRIRDETNFGEHGNVFYSYQFFIYDIETKQKSYQKLSLVNYILSVDRSEDELAVLTENGNVSIFSFQNNILKITDEYQIANLEKLVISKEYPTLGAYEIMFSKTKHQLVLKKMTFDSKSTKVKYYFLKIINKNELKALPLSSEKVLDVIKYSERLAMIYPSRVGLSDIKLGKLYFQVNEVYIGEGDFDSYYLHSLYLFKD